MDIWVMVDVVGNHVGPVGFDFSSISPYNQASHYHDNCDIKDWGNQWQVENCRLAGLPDLKHEDGFVRQQLKDWIKNLVNTYGFDGIRIDTIPEVPKDFWTEFG
jgi:alpha-amylase